MVKYDPKILQKFAGILYRRARTVIVFSTIFGLLIGAGLGAGYAPVFVQAFGHQMLRWVIPTSTTIIGGFLGWLIGDAIAFQYKLRAQLTLCQYQIEYNTRSKPKQEPHDERAQKALASLMAESEKEEPA